MGKIRSGVERGRARDGRRRLEKDGSNGHANPYRSAGGGRGTARMGNREANKKARVGRGPIVATTQTLYDSFSVCRTGYPSVRVHAHTPPLLYTYVLQLSGQHELTQDSVHVPMNCMLVGTLCRCEHWCPASKPGYIYDVCVCTCVRARACVCNIYMYI